MTDIEQLKGELKAEILEELKAEASRKGIPGLEAVRKKWFNGPDRKDKYHDSEMYKRFGNDQHKVWDSVRAIARVIFDMKSQTRLSMVNQEKLEVVCDSLCQLICELKEDIKEDK